MIECSSRKPSSTSTLSLLNPPLLLILKSQQRVGDRDLLLELGIVKNSNNGDYDKFYKRWLFPIKDHLGRVCGFTGRKLVQDENPKKAKYINSDDSLIYKKDELLYGLYENKDGIKKEGKAILIESNSSTVILWENGIRNVVAQGGTALNPKQAKLLRRFCDEVIVCYDADEAGQKAAKANIPTLVKAGFFVEICILPLKYKEDGKTLDKGDDPADFVLKHGGKTFEQYITDNKQCAITWTTMHTMGIDRSPADVDKATNEAVQLLTMVKSDTFRASLITKLSGTHYLKCGETDFKRPCTGYSPSTGGKTSS